MIDIKWIRSNPAAFDVALARRGAAPQSAALLALDETYRHTAASAQALQEERNHIAQAIGIAKKEGKPADDLSVRGAQIKDQLMLLESESDVLKNELESALSWIPNVVLETIPDGTSEADNVEVRRHGVPRTFDFTPKPHFELGEALHLMDFEKAAQMAGSRFVILKGALARLERAIAQFMLDTHTTKFGYEEVSPPYLVRSNAVFGVGQLPKFKDDLFQTTDGRWLISTSEISLTNLGAETIFEERDLPQRYTAYTPCFRSEAGSAGRDTRGMIRVHQFNKVELVSLVHPDEGLAELERMTGAAESILQELKLPYRVMELCAGDIGFQSQKTYDLEVWLPAQNAYREISSCSVCGDFQARRLKARFRDHSGKFKEKNPFVYTLNGSALAVGRTVVAVLENYQQADGSILVPDVLKPYMGGLEVIT